MEDLKCYLFKDLSSGERKYRGKEIEVLARTILEAKEKLKDLGFDNVWFLMIVHLYDCRKRKNKILR